MPEKNKLYSVLVNAVVEKDGKILISQRGLDEDHEPGKWTVPGGTLEQTERSFNVFEKTAKREVLEETGIEVEDKMHLLINNTFKHDKDGLLVVAIIFLCRYKSGETKPLEDTIDVRWITKEEIDNYDFPHPNVRSYVVKGFKFLEKK